MKPSVICLLLLSVIMMRPPAAHSTDYSRETPVVKAVRSVSPAVVNISTEIEVRRRASPFSGFGMDPLFEEFFKDFFDPGYEQKYNRTSLGSGVIIDGAKGYILTNAHVISKTGKIRAVLNDEREFEVQVVGADPDSDLAVLRIVSSTALPDIQMGNSDDLMIGETVIAIGNPFGFSNTVTTGVISALKRSIRTEDRVYHEFIQTDASINPGNSGGPLLNINGELIGINTAIYAKAQGIGFAIPINKARKIVSDLIRYGEVVAAWIGVTVQDVDPRLAQYMNLPAPGGVLIREVEKNGPGGKAGLQNGDIILSIGNQPLFSSEDYRTAMRHYAAGDPVSINLWRNGKKKTITATASIFPLELAKGLASRLMGITVEDLTIPNRSRFRIQVKDGALITEIHRQSYLAGIGVQPGDVIRQLDDITIRTVEDFEKAIVRYRQKPSVVILLQRGDQQYYITINF